MDMKIGKMIPLKNSTSASITKMIGRNLEADIPGMSLFFPGDTVPVICPDGCPCYGKITSVTLTENSTAVQFIPVKVSDAIATGAYDLYKIESGNSVIGSYQSSRTTRTRINDNSVRPSSLLGFGAYDDDDD